MMRVGLRDQEIFDSELQGTNQNLWTWVQSLETYLAKIGLGEFGFERRPPRRAHRVPFEILDDVAHVFNKIASASSR
jgi:hypothetical protein